MYKRQRIGDPDVVAIIAYDLARLHRKGWRIGDLLDRITPVSYTHLRAHETVLDLVCRLLLEKKKSKAIT